MIIKPIGASNFFSKAVAGARSAILSKAQAFKDNFHPKTQKVTFAPSKDTFQKLDENIQNAKTAYLKGDSFENVKKAATKNHSKEDKKLIKAQLQKMRENIKQDNLEGKSVGKLASQLSNDALSDTRRISQRANTIPKEELDKTMGLLDRAAWEGTITVTEKRQMSESHPTRKNKRALQHFRNQKDQIVLLAEKAKEKLSLRK